MFADYTFYTGTYGGSALTEASFPLYANQATAYLTGILSAVPAQTPDELKKAMCAVADVMFKDDSEHGGIQSESVGSWSRTYKGISKSASRRCFDAAMIYLSESDLAGRWI